MTTQILLALGVSLILLTPGCIEHTPLVMTLLLDIVEWTIITPFHIVMTVRIRNVDTEPASLMDLNLHARAYARPTTSDERYAEADEAPNQLLHGNDVLPPHHQVDVPVNINASRLARGEISESEVTHFQWDVVVYYQTPQTRYGYVHKPCDIAVTGVMITDGNCPRVGGPGTTQKLAPSRTPREIGEPIPPTPT